ncbi:Ras GTPase activating protein ira2 [Saitozyma podzolica]|uniref:Ras GTPase activating protein ira2 n=1 Tax=Saitozyma podzolica TaxID=1890683 RepID=A0A427YVA2_9TREE|nr:Ras GTPase activating protein ira2 [Saitozyma podzolica]
MPLKRSSLPGSPATLSSPAHKYRESFNASASSSSSTIPHDAFSMNEFGTVQRQPDGSAGELKVVGALVSRLVNKLPCNSGIRLGTVEIDQGVQTTVDALLRLARIRLPLVVQALVGALETLSKYSSSTSLHDTPLDTIHSQLFLLHVLYLCLSSSWRLHASVAPPPPSEIPRCFSDPPPFDESLARYLLVTLLTYAHMVSSEAALVGGTISPMSNREAKSRETPPAPWARHEHPGSSSNCIGLKFLQRHSYSSSQRYDVDERKLLAPTSGSTSATIGQMAKYVSRIIFYLSSSNWPLVLGRIKARVSFLTTTIEESPDLVELRLMEWSNPDRTRLSQVIQEISTTFLHIKRPAQVAVATVLRSCIWNWIRSYQGELEALVESNRNIEGGAETLFDVLNSASDISSSSSARKNKAFYPLMAMLLVVSPDTLKRAVLGEMAGRTSSSIAKRLNFLESLRKGLVTSKGFEACAVCYVDFVSAAMCLGPNLESAGVKSLVPDIQNDLKNALFYSSHSGDIDDDVLVSGLVGLYRTNAAISGTTVFSKLLNDISDSHKLLAVRACAEIVLEGDRLPWYPSVVGMRRDLAAPIRSLLKSLAASIVGTPSTARRPRSSVDVAQNVADLVSGILNLIAIDPAFAFTSYNAEDNLSSTLVTISSLLVGPCPEILRIQAGRAIVAVLDHLRAVAKVDAGTLALANSAAMAT